MTWTSMLLAYYPDTSVFKFRRTKVDPKVNCKSKEKIKRPSEN
jgi:hypothetical protein